MLGEKFGLEEDFSHLSKTSTPKTDPFVSESTNNTVIVIGMRGAGKSTLSRAAAKKLGAVCFDLDECIREEIKHPIDAIVREKGLPHFREIEMRVFRRLVRGEVYPRIISCGGGIVESKEFMVEAKRFPLVVQIVREFRYLRDAILDLDASHRVNLDEPLKDVWKRRRDLYNKASKYEFFVSEKLEKDVDRFAGFIAKLMVGKQTGLSDRLLSKESNFLCLTYSDYTVYFDSDGKKDEIVEITKGSNAVEMRIDCLKDFSRENIAKQFYKLRKATDLPIIYTCIPRSKGGKYPDGTELYKNAIALGFRLGCEFVSVEYDPELKFLRFAIGIANRNTKIIACSHPNRLTPRKIPLEELFEVLSRYADIIKIVTIKDSMSESLAFLKEAENLKKVSKKKAISIFIDLGEHGIFSRIYNKVLNPITHGKITSPAGKGQLTLQQLFSLKMNGLKGDVKLIGRDISKSLSPLIHNFVYKRLQLSLLYTLCPLDNLDNIESVIGRENARGFNVTMPFKESIISSLSSLSKEASEIGAVNTIEKVPGDGETLLVGHNTDWIGIKESLENAFDTLLPGGHCFRAAIAARNCKALILGAGGTAKAAAYALIGCGTGSRSARESDEKNAGLGMPSKRVYVYNRTFSRSLDFANRFECNFVKNTSEFLVNESEHLIVVVTIPKDARIELPPAVKTHGKAILLDVCYTEKETFCMRQMPLALSKITGVEVLVRQALRSIEIWTKKMVSVGVGMIIETLNQ